jgi:2-alkyl-3-oxoalkanoate reductase
MKTLVTGGGGFLGRYIVEQLTERGDEVTVFARGGYPFLADTGARLIRGDLQDAEAVRNACAGVDAVFHVAAKAGIWGRRKEFYGANVTGTRNLIAACREHHVPRLIYTSSPSVVFANRPQSGCDESLPWPEVYENFYSETKALGEQLARRANSADLLTVSLRPHLIWGPRDCHILPRIIQRARAGKLMQVGDGANRVDTTYVEDAARAHLLAADALQPGSPAAGSVYFISQDDPVNLWDWIGNLLTRLEIPPIRRAISLPAARRLGAIMETAWKWLPLPGEPRMTRFLASELAMDHFYDISRAKKELGYHPQWAMDDALEKTLAWLREHETF